MSTNKMTVCRDEKCRDVPSVCDGMMLTCQFVMTIVRFVVLTVACVLILLWTVHRAAKVSVHTSAQVILTVYQLHWRVLSLPVVVMALYVGMACVSRPQTSVLQSPHVLHSPNGL